HRLPRPIRGPLGSGRVVHPDPAVAPAHECRCASQGLGIAAVEHGGPAVTPEALAAVARYRESDELEVADLDTQLVADVVEVELVAHLHDAGRDHAVVVE